jgi:hypothetical protein
MDACAASPVLVLAAIVCGGSLSRAALREALQQTLRTFKGAGKLDLQIRTNGNQALPGLR